MKKIRTFWVRVVADRDHPNLPTAEEMVEHIEHSMREGNEEFGILNVTATFHHGNAVGADREAADIARDYLDGIDDIVAHPANGRPLERNKEIVAAVDMLIAAPRTDKEQLRSGTWTTVRRARDKGIPIVFLPRGRT